MTDLDREPGCYHAVVDTQHKLPARPMLLWWGTVSVLEPDGRMQWVNAGQNPPRIRRADGRIEELHATGVALGLFEGTTYSTSEQVLRSGDMLVAYSDGITEAENVAGVPFEEEGLDAVIGAWAAGSAPEITQAVQHAVLAHVGDDLTVLVLRRA